MAMSRGRQANTLYLANHGHEDHQCTHLTHLEGGDVLDALTASLGRSSTQTAAVDQYAGSPPSSSDIAERVAWIVASAEANTTNPNARQPIAS